MPNKQLYPYFDDAKRSFIHLSPGDCMFVPAFYFFQLKAYRIANAKYDALHATVAAMYTKDYENKTADAVKDERDTQFEQDLATVVSLRF